MEFPIWSIQLNSKERKIVEQYTEKIIKTDVYGVRNGQSNESKRYKDHIGSKLAEIGVYKFLDFTDVTSTYPDFKIKDKSEKNWDADMTSTNSVIHVKNQNIDSDKRYGISWIGEKADKELYQKNTGYVFLCRTDIENNVVNIFGCPEVTKIKDKFRDPVLPQHREKKFAIYYKDLVELDKNVLWGYYFDFMSRV